MRDTAAMQDFSHLARLEDGDRRVDVANEAVEALRAYIVPHEEAIAKQKELEEHRKRAFALTKQNEAIQAKLADMRAAFIEVSVSTDLTEQQKGYKLEGVLTDLLDLFDMDATGPFVVTGEQIDGAFSLEGSDFITEARWRKNPTSRGDLDEFKVKIERKAENTRGLYISINGYAQTAVDAHSGSGSAMILMDGGDLYAVLEGRIDLQHLILRKRRHASQTGNIYLPVREIL